MKLLTTLLGIALFSLAGCATQTPYKPAAERGAEGYTETQLTENRYRITFVGNTVTPSETVKDFALLRAAELTLQHGYEWFRIMERDNDKKVNSATTVGGGFSSPSHSSVYQRCGLVSCQTVVSHSPGFSTGLGVATTSTSSSYSYALEVVMGKAPMPQDAESYNARELAATLRRWMTTTKNP